MGHEGRPLWRRSTACGNEGECVEVALGHEQVLARDSKNPSGPTLSFTGSAWTFFLHAVVSGEFDGS
ncbi:DUF397 domain-containing protein [Streptomyces sp. NPDC051976]|uniref:DUF397 domain-containing protein n=1 Tax=Streptomyces sp. NPDC051976 TaxID=3154947 RepID=UPI003449F181